MGLYNEDIIDIDLNSGSVYRSFANKTISEGDISANRYGVRLWRGKTPATAEGATCMGYFIRHGNGDTVTINGGAFSGQKVYIDLPESCYAYDGAFTLVIKLIGGGVTGTMRVVDGTVINSMIGSPIDPGSVIPSLADLLEVIERAEDAAETIAGFSVYASQIAGDEYEIIVSTEVSS